MPELAEPVLWRFDDLLLDPQGGTLCRVHADGHTAAVHIGSRAFQLLSVLVGRRGELILQREILDAVWPNTSVEQNNLSVQVAALRRVLDANGGRGSSIQNIPGRGYRFASHVSAYLDKADDTNDPVQEKRMGPVAIGRRDTVWSRDWAKPLRDHLALVTACLLGLGALVVGIAWSGSEPSPPAESTAGALAPSFSSGEEALRRRLSLVVLPFENLGGDGLNDATVDAITGDITTELAHVPMLAVAARSSGFAYKGRSLDMRRIGQELGVRHILHGSVRSIDRVLRVNAHLVSAETNEHSLAERFDASPDTIDDVVRKIMTTVRFRLVETESARSARERPSNPGFADIMLRAMYNQHNLAPNPHNRAEVISLYERAVQLDPASVLALSGLAEALLDTVHAGPWDHPNAPAMLRKAEEFVRRAEKLHPDYAYLMFVKVNMLWTQDRCGELVPAAKRAIELHPSVSSPYLALGYCMLVEGRAAEAIPQFEKSIRVHPRNPQIWNRYLFKARALIELARYDEAVQSLNIAVASLPSASTAERRGALYGWIAAAQALANRLEEARATAAEASRVWPTLAVRNFYPYSTAHPAHAAQIAHVLNGLRLAGMRDHADEDADHGLESDAVLHTNYQAPTPKSVPGARTIRTTDLAALLERGRPLVLDTKGFGKSIPGAIGLSGAGIGGATSDEYQGRLKQKADQLTHGNRTAPIVTVGWNAERFDGRNLALRLAALGYTDVYWYRGGREAWEVAGLPTTEVVAQDW